MQRILRDKLDKTRCTNNIIQQEIYGTVKEKKSNILNSD